MKRYLRSRIGIEKAQTMVEFALVVPILLMLIWGIIEFGRLLFIYSSVTTASREGVRYGSAAGEIATDAIPRFLDCAGIRDAARRAAFLIDIPDDRISIAYDHGPESVPYATSCPPPASKDVYLGDRIVVTVSADYAPIIQLPFFTAFPITTKATRTIVKGVEIKGTPVPRDARPEVFFITTSQTVPESVGSITVQAQLTFPTIHDVTLTLAVSGTASGADFSMPLTIFIPGGEVLGSATLAIVNDTIDEYDETIDVVLDSAGEYATIITPKIFTITIQDDDDPPQVYFEDANSSVNEGQSTAIWVVLSNVSGKVITVPFSKTETALKGTDYTILPDPDTTPIVIPEMTPRVPIVVNAIDDHLYEDNELVVLKLGMPDNATLGMPPVQPTEHVLTIVNMNPKPTVNFDLASQAAPPGVKTMTLKVQLDAVSSKDAIVPLEIDPASTAIRGTEYSIAPDLPTSVTIPAGQTSMDIVITVLAHPEETKTIIINMGTPTDAIKGSPNIHTATLLGTKQKPTVYFTVAQLVRAENAGVMTVNIQLSNTWNQAITVPFTVGGSASIGADFNVTGSPVTIPQDTMYVTVQIQILEDNLYEGNESVILTLGTPSAPGETFELGTPSQFMGIIVDNETTPVVSFALAGEKKKEGSGPYNVVVQLSAVSGQNITVPYSVGGTAVQGTDYTLGLTPPGPVVIPAGSLSANIPVTVLDNNRGGEPEKSVVLTLGTPSPGATLGSPNPYTLIIEDNEICPTATALELPNPLNSGNKMPLYISYDTGAPLTILDVTIFWNDSGGQKLDRIYWRGSKVFEQNNVTASPTYIPGQYSWLSGANLSLNPGETSLLFEVQFRRNLGGVPGDYSVRIDFNNGCYISR